MALFSLKKKTRAAGQVALIKQSAGLSYAHIQFTGSRPHLLALTHQPIADDTDAALGTAVKAFKLGQTPIHTVLPLGSYQLLLVDMPKVPANEIKAAVRWQIKDLIDFHIDDAVVDVFNAPPVGAGGTQDQSYVVITHRNQIQKLADTFQQAELNLEVIDIPELVLRNIAAQLPGQEQGIAVLYLEPERGVIALCKDQSLYLARTIETGYQVLVESDPDTQSMILSTLALEVQRTLDYYDRHFQQAAINTLYVAPMPVETPGLLKAMQSQLGLECHDILAADVVEGAQVDQDTWARAFLALGAALRHETKAL